jgi:TetR/AcrR family transcriptional repressor of mexJK operon
MSKAMENYLHKRKIIVNSAKTLFLGKGFTATSMDKVAQKTGITKQTIYRYFPSKMDLFKATLEAAVDSDKRDYVFGDRDIKLELFDFGKVFLQFHMKKERLNIIRLIVAEGRKDKELSQIFYETRQKIHGFEIFISYLQKQIPQTNDTKFLANLFFEMLLSIRMPVLIGIQGIPSEDEMVLHVNKVVDFFLAGCKVSPKDN